ncbi:MAG: polysaccharide lyase family 7 protein [Bacteroidota bacterium]
MSTHRIYLRVYFIAIILLPYVSFAQITAFPGAEGAGALATGGRGGDVYHVINLNDDGAGSLRDAIATAPSNGRTIVFDISGTISLVNRLKIDKNNLTIAGQTAPGQGICIKGRTLIQGNNIILRHLHFRPHEQTGNGDAVNINGHDIIVDHCSASWSSDEVMSTEAADVYNISVQWSYIYEGLDTSYHYENGILLDHSMGSLFSTLTNNAKFSVHHNLYASNRTRNPKPTTGGAGVNLYFDFRNNVIYNWGTKAGYSTEETDRSIFINYVGNYLIAGPTTKSSSVNEAFEGMATTNFIYQENNKIDNNRNAVFDGINTGWNMITGIYTKALSPYTVPLVNTTSPDIALVKVLDSAGAMWWNRDAADLRVTSEVRSGTGKIINWPEQVGGWPNIAVVSRSNTWDTDQDGMPDLWENAHGTGPNNAADRNSDSDSDGYTNLEEYLNSILNTFGQLATKTYVFTGNGNWNNGNNWQNNLIAPTKIPDGTEVIIDPSAGGQCVFNRTLYVQPGAILTVSPSDKFMFTNGPGTLYPADVLDLTNWKLNLPIDANGTQTGTSVEIKQVLLDTFTNALYYHNNNDNTGVVFMANTGGATTSGSGYPRSELREMTSNGMVNASWSSSSGTHTMEIEQAVMHLPDVKKHIVVGQIHDAEDDVIVFRLEGTKLFMDHNGDDGVVLDNNYVLGTRFKVKMLVSNNNVYSYYNDVLKETYPISFSGAYFKAGSYVQSSCKGTKKVTGESCDAYGEVVIYKLSVTHN